MEASEKEREREKRETLKILGEGYFFLFIFPFHFFSLLLVPFQNREMTHREKKTHFCSLRKEGRESERERRRL